MSEINQNDTETMTAEIAFALASDIVSGVTSSVVSSADAVYKSLSQQGMKLADAVTGTVKELSEKSKDLVESFKKNEGAAIIKKSESLMKDIKEDKTLKKVGDGLKNIFK